MRLYGLVLAVGCSFGIFGCNRAYERTDPAPSVCVAGPLADTLSPTRDGFFREVLFAEPTARTPRYDDYTPGSYHVDKLDVLAGIPSAADACGLDLEGLLMIGPVGPLWAYHVIAFVRDADSVRMSRLVMPHARITGKARAGLSRERLTQFYDSLQRSPLLRDGLPTAPGGSEAERTDREWSYDVLLVRFGPGKPRYWHASVRGADEATWHEFFAPIDRLLQLTTVTYPDTVARSAPSRPDA